MAVPPFIDFRKPVLELFSDGQEHSVKEAIRYCTEHLLLTPEDQEERLASGQKRVYNRVHWTATYLMKALLLDRTRRGYYKITERGKEVFKENPDRIDIKYLSRYREFREFCGGKLKNESNETPEISNDDDSQTPEEIFEESYQQIRSELAGELLDKVKGNSPAFFEQLVVHLLVKMGYGGSREDAGKAIGKPHDGGIDGVIKEDKLGLDLIYLQAKRWENTVGERDIRDFVGALTVEGAGKGIFITTSLFSSSATSYAERLSKPKVVLLDGFKLADLMIEYGVGVSVETKYEIKKIDSDYFDEF